MFPKAVFAPVGQVTGPIGWVDPAPENDVYLFDLDALVPSPKGQMDVAFERYLSAFVRKRSSYILSNTSITDMMTRLPSSVRSQCAGLFAAAGTELWVGDDLVFQHQHEFSDDLYEFMVKVVQKSDYPSKQAPMLESGSASLRLCIAGYQSSLRQIKDYAVWEREHDELATVSHEFKARFPDHDVYRDTETSLMIVPGTFSSAVVASQLLQRHDQARLIGYVTPQAAGSYAGPLCEAFGIRDVLSTIKGPGEVSQLLSYEIRRMSQQETTAKTHTPERVEA